MFTGGQPLHQRFALTPPLAQGRQGRGLPRQCEHRRTMTEVGRAESPAPTTKRNTYRGVKYPTTAKRDRPGKGRPLFKRGEGSIRFDGRWELIDHFLVGNDEGLRPFEMSVVQVPFLMTEDRTHTGFKPMRTYVGPRYAGGVSDHCPILLEISQKIYNFGSAWRKSPARHTY